jgi:glutaredoxin
LRVVLYTKEDCGLCEDAAEVLRRARRLVRFDLERVFIDNDKELLQRHGERVPVVTIDGREVASAPVDEASLLAALSHAANEI